MHEESHAARTPLSPEDRRPTVGATITSLKHKVNVNTLEHLAAKMLELNEIGDLQRRPRPANSVRSVHARIARPGSFILIDRLTNETVGAGLIHFALRRADNIHWQALDVNKRARAGLKGQKPASFGSRAFREQANRPLPTWSKNGCYSTGKHTYLLDGDNVRHGLNKDLGFTDADRVENIRRVAEVARLMVDAGSSSWFRSFRRSAPSDSMARDLVAEGEFIEVFVDTPLEEAEKRDAKGLYKKARRGELQHFTGIDSPVRSARSTPKSGSIPSPPARMRRWS